MKRTSSGTTTRRGTIDELDVDLLATLEERQDRLYAILSTTTRYRNILSGEIKQLRAGRAPGMVRPLVAEWEHLRREIKRLAQEL
jgi:seryl-tRNA synthetase